MANYNAWKWLLLYYCHDELQNALTNGDITQQQFDLALNTCDKLKNGLLSDNIAFKNYLQKMYDMVKW